MVQQRWNHRTTEELFSSKAVSSPKACVQDGAESRRQEGPTVNFNHPGLGDLSISLVISII